MMERRPATLRNVLSFAAITLTLLAATAALALVLATSVLQRTTARAAAAVESVRTIEEAEVALLLHTRSNDREQQVELSQQLHELLDAANSYVDNVEEARVLAEARIETDYYLQLAQRTDLTAAELKLHEMRAIGALERLADLDVAQARAFHAHARRWDEISRVSAIALGVSMVGFTISLVLYLRRRVMKPLFALADTMKLFGEGQRGIRAEESGPVELRDMTRRFNEMADATAAQREAQTAFLGGVAHDLRNPLTALKLATDLVDPAEPLPAEPQLRNMLGIIRRQIDQLDRMVGDFLDMAKIEAGTLELRIAEHDVRTIVKDSLELFESTAKYRLSIMMPQQPTWLACDAVRIGQAITNLISNAIKYSPPDEPIEVLVTADVSEVRIQVTDHGIGMTGEEAKRAFEPFRRGATRSTIPGTGLGLFNVKRIVQAHGGRIDLESVASVGSTFRIHLPRTGAPAARGDEPAAQPA
jgi:signal transduction histidine kinase